MDRQTSAGSQKSAVLSSGPSQGSSALAESFGREDSDEESLEMLGNSRMNAYKLTMMAGRDAPIIPDYPAPPAPPPHHHIIPAALVYETKVESTLSRTLNSSVGRLFTFIVSAVLFAVAAWSLIDLQEPVRRMHQQHYGIVLLAIASLLALYSCVPMLSEKAGMHSKTTGWKPYLVLYRCSFMTAAPAFACFYYGYGAAYGFGEPAGVAGEVLVSDLVSMSANYFEAADGFVALNLTKGIWKTVSRSEHGGVGQRRVSRFRDAELLINTEPFTGLSEPTVPPGALDLYVMAPIFSNWEACATKYRISSTCLGKHPPRGWAIIKTESICNDLGLLACRPTEPEVAPVYKCSTDAIQGRETTGPVQGLCGRVVLPPPPAVIDELGALLLAEQWPKNVLPNMTTPWIDVTADGCIAQPAACIANWNVLGTVGILLSVMTIGCIVVPAIFDWKTDNRIRDARRFWENPAKFLQQAGAHV